MLSKYPVGLLINSIRFHLNLPTYLIFLLTSLSSLLTDVGLRVTICPQRDPVPVTALAGGEQDVGLLRSFH